MPGVGTTHDVRIGDHYYLIKPGTYRKAPAPLRGARFTTGDPDYNNLTDWQYWVQKCWVGGMGASEWKDDAMFDEGVGVDTRHHEVMVLSRDLGPNGTQRTVVGSGGENWVLSGSTHPKIFFKHGYALYCLDMGAQGVQVGRVYRWSPDLPTVEWELIYTFPTEVRSAVQWGNGVFFGTGGVNMYRMGGVPGAEGFSTITKPANKQGVDDKPASMGVYKNRLYVDFGTQIWRLKVESSSFVWDGTTPFYEDNAIDYSNHMEVHQGFLYIGTNNGHLLRTDGNNTFDMWQFEPGLHIWGMRSFDGRLFLFVGDQVDGVNNDPFSGGRSYEAALYQFTGAAVTELKRWGRVGRYISPSRLYVHDGKLFFGAGDLLGTGDGTGGFGIAMYDPVEDAFHLVATNQDTTTYAGGTDNGNFICDDVTYHDGYLWVMVRGHGVFRTAYTYRDMERYLATYDNSAAGLAEASKNGGWYESSDFDAGTPGLNKLWDSIIIQADIPDASCSLWVDYSTDGGQSWVSLGAMTSLADPVASTRKIKRYPLTDQSLNRVVGARFKYRITLRTTDTAYSPVLRGVAIRYLPIPEPTWDWHMTVVVADRMALHDDTTETWAEAKITDLRTAFRDQSFLYFQEPGGTATGAVRIEHMEERIPSLYVQDASNPREYEIGLILREMVDDYLVLDP